MYNLLRTFVHEIPNPSTRPLHFIFSQLVEPLLPYALSFAAGAMVFVVVDDIIPEALSWWVREWGEKGAWLSEEGCD